MSRRLNALVIGNAAYEAVDELKNPVNDAQYVAGKLEIFEIAAPRLGQPRDRGA